MIVKKIYNSEKQAFVPDLSEVNLSLWAYDFQMNEDGETYEITLKWKSEIPFSISKLQGRLQLNKMGLLESVESLINQAGLEAKIYWESSANWERVSPILNRLAPTIWPQNTDQMLDDFFVEASKLS